MRPARRCPSARSKRLPASFPTARVATNQQGYHGAFDLRGERRSLSVAVAFPRVGRRWWDVIATGGDFPRLDTHLGQYTRLAGGHGKQVVAGGHKNSWYARLDGLVIPADRGPKQRIVITLKGWPKGTFVLIPTQPGVLKRDSGTQSSDWSGAAQLNRADASHPEASSIERVCASFSR